MESRGNYSAAEIIGCIQAWEQSDKTLRLGQWWYLKMDKTGVEFPELFYADTRGKASKLIWEYYSRY